MVPIPKSRAATSKAHRVRVEVFSKISATFFPSRQRWGMPAFFLAFRSAAVSRNWPIWAGVKSRSLRKWVWSFMGGSSLLVWGAVHKAVQIPENPAKFYRYSYSHSNSNS